MPGFKSKAKVQVVCTGCGKVCEEWPNRAFKSPHFFCGLPCYHSRAYQERRFWERVDKSGDCWVWTGFCEKSGYGRLGFLGRIDQAHRIAYELLVGPIPEGKFLLHSCDNPPCCNPAHLRPGTHAENMADMFRRGRADPGGKKKRAA